ncbi:MAG TPA: hypothetical protein PKN08_07965 [Opitutaceae bacterium]|nr:hypothetical protein [Opitutaceae bacterium]
MRSPQLHVTINRITLSPCFTHSMVGEPWLEETRVPDAPSACAKPDGTGCSGTGIVAFD